VGPRPAGTASQSDGHEGLLLGQWRRWRFDHFGPQCMQDRTLAPIGNLNDCFDQAHLRDSTRRVGQLSRKLPFVGRGVIRKTRGPITAYPLKPQVELDGVSNVARAACSAAVRLSA